MPGELFLGSPSLSPSLGLLHMNTSTYGSSEALATFPAFSAFPTEIPHISHTQQTRADRVRNISNRFLSNRKENGRFTYWRSVVLCSVCHIMKQQNLGLFNPVGKIYEFSNRQFLINKLNTQLRSSFPTFLLLHKLRQN